MLKPALSHGLLPTARASYICLRCELLRTKRPQTRHQRLHTSRRLEFAPSAQSGLPRKKKDKSTDVTPNGDAAKDAAGSKRAEKDKNVSSLVAKTNTSTIRGDSKGKDAIKNTKRTGNFKTQEGEGNTVEGTEENPEKAGSTAAAAPNLSQAEIHRLIELVQQQAKLHAKRPGKKSRIATITAPRKVLVRKNIQEGNARFARTQDKSVKLQAVRDAIDRKASFKMMIKDKDLAAAHSVLADSGVSLEEALSTRRQSQSIPKENLGKTLRGAPVSIKTGEIILKAIDVDRKPVPRLAYGLDRTLFNPGVIELRDLKSRVYNFDPYLEKIVPVAEFDFNTLKQFTTSSKDTNLQKIATEHNKKYVGSSSSTTGLLKHLHYLLSTWRPPNVKMMSRNFPVQASPTFTAIQRGPESIFLRWKDGTYAIDHDKEYDSPNILSMMGQYMELLFTVDKDVFERHRVGKSHLLTEEERNSIDSYHYSTIGDIVMRSQLDAYSPKLPGTGMFDLKTRAVLPIRMNSREFQDGMDYELKQHKGEYESFEREYYDMLRATLLKYSLQVRIGRMNGILVAYHNIARIFGFQYIDLEEMDEALHGQRDRCLGDQEFFFSMKTLSDVLNKATEKFPEQTLRILVETRPSTNAPFMYIFVEPVTEEEADAVQNKNSEVIKEWERNILGLAKPEGSTYSTGEETEDEITSNILPTQMQATGTPRESSEDSPESDGAHHSKTRPDLKNIATEVIDSNTSADTDFLSNLSKDFPFSDPGAKEKSILGMILTVKHTINGSFAERPSDLKPTDEWELNYTLEEMTNPSRASALYQACKNRRRAEFSKGVEEAFDEDARYKKFLRELRVVSDRSAEWRKEMDKRDESRPVVMWDDLEVLNRQSQADSTISDQHGQASSETASPSIVTRNFAAQGGGILSAIGKIFGR